MHRNIEEDPSLTQVRHLHRSLRWRDRLPLPPNTCEGRSRPARLCRAAMARFYFQLYNNVGFVPDQQGQLLPDLDSARQQAIGSIRSMVSEDAKQGVVDLGGRIEIMSESGDLLDVIRFAEAVEVRLGEESR